MVEEGLRVQYVGGRVGVEYGGGRVKGAVNIVVGGESVVWWRKSRSE